MRTLLILPLILLILGGCAAQSTRTDDGLYRAAMQAYDDQNWQAAAEQLAVLESANGGTGPVDQVRIHLAHSHAQLGQSGDCIDSVNRFVQQHPRHREMGQMLMLRGECHQQLGRSPNAPDSAGSALRLAIRDFNFVATRLTNSPLQEAAQNRADALRQQLARAELQAAENHLKAGEYAAAANRSRYVMENFQNTAEVAGALEVLAAAYEGLGLHDRAASTRAVLQGNYPSSDPSAGTDTLLPGQATATLPLQATAPPLAIVTVVAAPPALAPAESVIAEPMAATVESVDAQLKPMDKPDIALSQGSQPTEQPTEPAAITALKSPLIETTSQKSSVNTEAPVVAAAAPKPLTEGWVLQVASFSNAANARRLTQKLKDAGYASFTNTQDDFARVLIGYEAKRGTVKVIRTRIQQEFGFNGLIRHSDDFH